MVASRSRSDYEITCLFETRSILEMNITRKLISEYLENSTRSGRNFHDGSSTNFISSFHNFLWYFALSWNTLIRTIILHVIRSMHRATFYVFFAHRDRYFPPPLPFPLLFLSPSSPFPPLHKLKTVGSGATRRHSDHANFSISIDYGYDSVATGVGKW